jgi:hypothetical protein
MFSLPDHDCAINRPDVMHDSYPVHCWRPVARSSFHNIADTILDIDRMLRQTCVAMKVSRGSDRPQYSLSEGASDRRGWTEPVLVCAISTLLQAAVR